MLSNNQIAFYRNKGYLTVTGVFDTDELAELNQATDDFVEQSRQISENTDKLNIGPGHSATNPNLRRVLDPEMHHAAYAKAMRSSKLLEILKPLIGPAIRFDHGKLNIKEVGGDGGKIDWHQDWAFYPQTNEDMLAVGVYLKDCGLDEGPLMVVPESHKGPILDHHQNGYFVGSCNPKDIGDGLKEAVALTGKAGDITLHHVRTLHGSKNNTGKCDRRLLLLSYKAADAWPLVPYNSTDFDAWNSRLLSGEVCYAPRQEALPVRLPLPEMVEHDSLYELQASAEGREFALET